MKNNKKKKHDPVRHLNSVTGALMIYMILILINAVLFTFATCMLLDRLEISSRWSSYPQWPFVPLAICVLFGVLLVMSFSGQKLRPIQRVSEAMKKVAAGDFSQRVHEKHATGEIRELVDCYNRMAEELSDIEMFRSDFINNFSHEFKTPIVSIRGFARQLERDDLTEEQRREYAHIIARESERLANMSSNILLLTGYENIQIITDKTNYSLDEQLRSCILLLEKQWSDKELELDLQLDDITYYGNEEMMNHVWVNLLNNAVKFSPQGGLLEVSCMRVQNFIQVQITDHGEGMTSETQARIFEKFYQGDTAHATEGNGLGLPLANRIVQLCGGKIAVTSAPNMGATFTVYLPV